MLAPDLALPDVSPPAVPEGREGYGVRAGQPPWQELGRPAGWLGSAREPRGGWARIGTHEDEMAGTWQQWKGELARDPLHCLLSGYIEANWLHASQHVIGADASKRAIHLSVALAYGWGWRKNDTPFRIHGLLCELDRPGEWHFDAVARRLYVWPPDSFGEASSIAVPAARGFLALRGATFVSVVGLRVERIALGFGFRIEGGSDDLIASSTVCNSPAGGVFVDGSRHRVLGCDFFDLYRHCVLRGGRRGPGLLVDGGSLVENCHFYQKGFGHRGISISILGVGNRFRHNLVHSSIGQAVVVGGNDHMLEQNEFFDIGYEEGDGGAVYSGAGLLGYGNTYRHNFFHHLMGAPGKVERSGIHLDDC